MSSIDGPAPPEYSFASPRKQLFSFPPDVISRMLENPSSHAGLMKLYQTCKYFYAKRPILIADNVTIRYDLDDEHPIPRTILALGYVGEGDHYEDITHLQVPLWLTNELRIFSFCGHRLQKIFRSSITKLFVCEGDLQYDDFVFLVSEKNVTKFNIFCDAILYHSDKSKVSIEEVLQHLPNIQKICFYINEKCTLDSLIKLNLMKFNNKFEYIRFVIYDVDSTFVFDLFCEFIMKNCDAKTEFRWHLKRSQNLKDALAKMNPKWKIEAHDGMKELFRKIASNEDS